ncbi:hypothetical protein M2302_004280 [Micromonospora sp. A200]|nr:hypothetical protein [Micromonospora sp. A200]
MVTSPAYSAQLALSSPASVGPLPAAPDVTKSAHLFHADGTITAQDASGRKYEVDGEAAIYGNEDAKGFLDEINPGNSVKANVYFDVPKGTKLKTITFDAGLFTLAEDAVVTL